MQTEIFTMTFNLKFFFNAHQISIIAYYFVFRPLPLRMQRGTSQAQSWGFTSSDEMGIGSQRTWEL